MKSVWLESSLTVSETAAEPFFRHFIGLTFLFISMIGMGSYAYCFLAISEKEEPLVWYENKSGVALPDFFEQQLQLELQQLGFEAKKPLREGYENWLLPGQVQIVFLNVGRLPWNQRVRLRKDLQGEASYSQQRIYIYLDRYQKMGGDLWDLVDLSLHEIGHAVGNLQHSEDSNNLMYPYFDYERQAPRILEKEQMETLKRGILAF